MKRIIIALAIAGWLGSLVAPSFSQNVQCPDRPASSNDNSCANTRWVKANGGGGGGGSPGGSNGQVQYNNSGAFGGYNNVQLTALINPFTSILSGAAPASGGGITNFLRADGTWAEPSGGGSAIVGTILPWTGASVPSTYLLAYGQAVSRATYSDLFDVITLKQNGISCTNGNPVINVTADVAARAPNNAKIEAPGCFAPGTTILSRGTTTLTLSANAIASTSANLIVFPWGNGDGSTTFNIPDLQGRSLVGRDNMSGTAAGTLTGTFYGVSPDAIGAIGGSQSRTLVQANLPNTPISVSITDPGHTHTINTSATAGAFNNNGGGGGAFSAMSSANATIQNATTGITASASLGGSSTAFSVVQPSVTIDWIIKALPDSNVVDGTIVVGSTIVANGSTGNVLYNNAGVLGEYTLSTNNQYNCATAGSIVTPSVVYQSETTTTYGTTTTFDFCTFKNTKVTLTGNITTMTFSNVVAGKAGMITFIQDGSGNHTTVWNTALKFSGGVTPTLSTAAGAVDILTYACRSPTFCGASLLLDVK